MKKAIRKLLRLAGYDLFPAGRHYAEDGLWTFHNDDFRKDPVFRAAYERGVAASGGIDPHFEWRVHVVLWAAAQALQVPGDFVECGVNAGFMSSAVMHRLGWAGLQRRFFLIDTFSGPVLEQFSNEEIQRGRRRIAEETLQSGGYVTDLGRIRASFAEWPNAVVMPGAVPAVLGSVPSEQVAFLHLDMNCAMPEQAALEFFWDRMPSGAVVVLDDYAYFGHGAQKRAIDEAAAQLGANVLSLPTGQGLILR